MILLSTYNIMFRKRSILNMPSYQESWYKEMVILNRGFCHFSLTLAVFILAHPFVPLNIFSILSQKNYGHGPIQPKAFLFAHNHIRDTVSIILVFFINSISASIVPADILLGRMLFINCLFVLLLYIPSQQLWSWWDSQFT